MLERLEVLGARQQVVEAVRLQEHRDQVRLAGLVDRDEPLLEDLDRLVEALLRGSIEPGLRRVRARPASAASSAATAASLLRSAATCEVRSLELGRLMADPGGEHAGVRPRVGELVLRRVELLLEALAGGAAAPGCAQAQTTSAPQSASISRLDPVI